MTTSERDAAIRRASDLDAPPKALEAAVRMLSKHCACLPSIAPDNITRVGKRLVFKFLVFWWFVGFAVGTAAAHTIRKLQTRRRKG